MSTMTVYDERARALGAGSHRRASLGQERDWAYQARFPEAAAFNVPSAVLLRGLPLRLGVVAGIAVGIAAGFAAEHWQRRGERS